MDKNSGRAPPIPALPATSLRQAIEPSPEKSSTSFEQQQEEEEEEERPERNDVRKPRPARNQWKPIGTNQ